LGTAAVIQERGSAYLIGVDTDWAVTYPEFADIVLTSVEKRADVSVGLAVQALVDGTFTGGTHVGTLATGETGLAPFHALEHLVSAGVRAELEALIAEIGAGRVKTRP
jgi:basic membrane protein A and related proteins